SIGRVDRPSVQRLVDVATRVAAAYGFGAPHPVITMTTSPDAYAVWYTDGLRVEINPLMLELVGGNDDTLAALVAHVLAHTRDRSYSNNPQQREMEADQKALRAMADAGFNLQGAAVFWQTMQAHPRAVWNDSHPSYPERAKVLAAAVAAAHH
ncbi:MAG TPA: M48 family metalloprotease, partial [Ramlibacter sp.]